MHLRTATSEFSSSRIHIDKFISLRLLALILCSNCSKTFNKVLLPPGNNLLNYFLQLGAPLQLAE